MKLVLGCDRRCAQGRDRQGISKGPITIEQRCCVLLDVGRKGSAEILTEVRQDSKPPAQPHPCLFLVVRYSSLAQCPNLVWTVVKTCRERERWGRVVKPEEQRFKEVPVGGGRARVRCSVKKQAGHHAEARRRVLPHVTLWQNSTSGLGMVGPHLERHPRPNDPRAQRHDLFFAITTTATCCDNVDIFETSEDALSEAALSRTDGTHRLFELLSACRTRNSVGVCWVMVGVWGWWMKKNGRMWGMMGWSWENDGEMRAVAEVICWGQKVRQVTEATVIDRDRLEFLARALRFAVLSWWMCSLCKWSSCGPLRGFQREVEGYWSRTPTSCSNLQLAADLHRTPPWNPPLLHLMQWCFVAVTPQRDSLLLNKVGWEDWTWREEWNKIRKPTGDREMMKGGDGPRPAHFSDTAEMNAEFE
ncbi:hypothetical protein BDZ97DRAFT_1759847 [Flammula alnicola]|nr:hypothetical protein BDZ97DRAFT_1964773 [Flammula alnicola]KAF8961679.1 hypothetical protein BDZ97DRAFT_1759847 [Flammula alnicola]